MAANNHRDMPPEWKAARTAKTISTRNARHAKIETCRLTPQECLAQAQSDGSQLARFRTTSSSRCNPTHRRGRRMNKEARSIRSRGKAERGASYPRNDE